VWLVGEMKIYWQLFSAWFRMGLFTFGGGYAMLPMIEREVIQKYHWASEEEVMEYYAIGQCTPGVIAVNTATFVGYSQKGVLGGIVATLGVITPSILIIGVIAAVLSNFADIPLVQSALKGVNAAVCVLMAGALKNLWNKNLKNIAGYLIFVCALVLSLFTSVSTVWLVVAAGAAGVIASRMEKKS
jgi:chromate transporter